LVAGWIGKGGALFFAQSCFFGLIVMLWGVTAYLLGKRFDRAVENNEVIGVDQDEQ
jgi:hypothetical protein